MKNNFEDQKFTLNQKEQEENRVYTLKKKDARFVREVVSSLSNQEKHSFFINIKKKQSFQFKKITETERLLLTNLLNNKLGLWGILSKKKKNRQSKLFFKFERILKKLKFEKKLKSFKKKPEIKRLKESRRKEKTKEQTFISVKGKVFCVCNKVWNGELMVECDKCNEWFHPKCISFSPSESIEIFKNRIFCFKCKISLQSFPFSYLEKKKSSSCTSSKRKQDFCHKKTLAKKKPEKEITLNEDFEKVEREDMLDEERRTFSKENNNYGEEEW